MAFCAIGIGKKPLVNDNSLVGNGISQQVNQDSGVGIAVSVLGISISGPGICFSEGGIAVSEGGFGVSEQEI
jgi:hypothetical protein